MKAWVDLTLMSLTFILSIIWNIEVGVVVSLVISLLMVVHRSSKTRMTILVCGDEFFVPCYVSIYYRAVFPVPTDGNRSKKILKQRKVWQELSLFKFGKIWISVGRLTSFFARQNFLCYLFAIANTAQLKYLSIEIKTSNHSYPNPALERLHWLQQLSQARCVFRSERRPTEIVVSNRHRIQTWLRAPFRVEPHRSYSWPLHP